MDSIQDDDKILIIVNLSKWEYIFKSYFFVSLWIWRYDIWKNIFNAYGFILVECAIHDN